MKLCQTCQEWAQWEWVRVEYPGEKENEKAKAMHMVRAGPRSISQGSFCAKHKPKVEAGQSLIFIGAAPLGA